MFEDAFLLGVSAGADTLGLSHRADQAEVRTKFCSFVVAHGWTEQQAFKTAYREVRKAINVDAVANDYFRYCRTEELPDYVVAFMDGDFGSEGVWSDDY